MSQPGLRDVEKTVWCRPHISCVTCSPIQCHRPRYPHCCSGKWKQATIVGPTLVGIQICSALDCIPHGVASLALIGGNNPPSILINVKKSSRRRANSKVMSTKHLRFCHHLIFWICQVIERKAFKLVDSSWSQTEAERRKWFPGKSGFAAAGNEDPVGWPYYLSYSYTHRLSLHIVSRYDDICYTREWYCWQSIWVSPNAMMRYHSGPLFLSSQIGTECINRSKEDTGAFEK